MVKSSQVICLGEILLDCLADDVGCPWEEVKSWRAYPGGAPANVACALVKLGTSSAFVGCVGSDSSGEELVKKLTTVGVDTEGIQRHPSAPTRQVYVSRSLEGDRHFAGFGSIPTTAFADAYLSTEKLPEFLFTQADYLIIGTLELAYPQSRQAVFRAVELSKQQGIKVVLDVNWRQVFWEDVEEAIPLIHQLLPQVDFLKCSLEESQWLFVTENPSLIRQQLPTLQGVMVTDGEKGCTYDVGVSSGHLPAYVVEVVDTTGAGDAFVAGFVHQCCQQGEALLVSPEKTKAAMMYASAVGALTTTKAGAMDSQPTHPQVLSLLQSCYPPF